MSLAMHMAYSLVKSLHSCTPPTPHFAPQAEQSLGKSPNSFSQAIAGYSFPEKDNSLLPLWSLFHGQERTEVEEAYSTTTPSARNVQRPESIESNGPKAREVTNPQTVGKCSADLCDSRPDSLYTKVLPFMS